MKLIPLTQGKYAMVDDEDYEMLMQYKWSYHVPTRGETGYAITNTKTINGKRKTGVKMHRMILGLTDPMIHVDHIDHNGINNQKDNLRSGTHAQNMGNRRKNKNATSKHLGVCRVSHKVKNKLGEIIRIRSSWMAQISIDNKKIHIGVFQNEIDAAKAYDEYKIKIGNFINLNFPMQPLPASRH